MDFGAVIVIDMSFTEPDIAESPQSAAARERRRARLFVDRERRTILIHIGSGDPEMPLRRSDAEKRRERLRDLFERALNEFGAELASGAPVDLRAAERNLA